MTHQETKTKSNTIPRRKRIGQPSTVGGTDPSVEVVYALAEACDTDPTKLEPLSDVIDPQALDQLCRGQNCDSDGTVVFNYHRHKVRIESYGVIEVQPLQ